MKNGIFSAFLIALTMVPQGEAKAQVAPLVQLAAGSAVSGIINDLKQNISQLISQLDNSLSARSFQVRSELSFLMSELEFRSLRLADKTFSQLTKQQQIFFENTSKFVTQTNATLKDGIEGSQDILTQSEQLLGQIPFIGEEPRVRKVSPLYVQSKTEDEKSPVPITISGSFLKHGPATLKFGDISCDVLASKEAELTFACPSSLFVSATTVSFVSGMLEVEDDANSWDAFKKIFGHYKPRKQYGINITAVPREIGTFSIEATYRVVDLVESSRSGEWGFTNDHCTDRTSRQYNFGPQGPGWNIDVNSISTVEQCSRYSGGSAIRNAVSTGFQVEAWTQNSGRCEKIFGSIVSYDARGCSAGVVNWLERFESPRQVKTELASGSVFWSVDQVVPLPSDLIGFTVLVNQIDGRVVALSSAVSDKWFSVERDASSTSLIIRPKSLKDAME